MVIYGKRSFFLFNIFVLPFIGFACYLAVTGKVSVTHMVMAAISLIILPLVAYYEYFVVTVEGHKLNIAWPLQQKSTSYKYEQIQSVSIDTLPHNKKPTLIIYKKDKTKDEHILPSLFSERKQLLKEINKYVHVQ